MVDEHETDDTFLRELARSPAITPRKELEAGTRVGAFVIERLLGRGGMGMVYLAHDTKLDRDVALKLLPPGMADSRARTRFRREAKSAGRVLHPQIATVFEIGESEDALYIAMEHVDGQTLRQRIAAGPLEVEEALHVARSIAEALQHAHSLGIVHRDIKPDNVMVTDDGVVKVLDFGLAKLRRTSALRHAGDEGAEPSQLTVEGHIMGTPGYMSPEQARGEEVDRRTDVFALGVVLHEMVTGRQPFAGATPIDRLAATTRDEPASIEAEPAIDAIVKRCLAKDREARLADCGEFLEALAAVHDVRKPSVARRFVMFGMAAVLATGGWLIWSGRDDSANVDAVAPSEGKASVLESEDAVLACPPLAASGFDAPSTWMGAAAADLACRHAGFFMDGRDQRTRVPAELLEVPSKVSTGVQKGLYDQTGARERAITAAKQAQAWLDGEVSWSAGAFRVHLVTRLPGGESLAEATGTERHLHRAVAAAVEGLVRADVIPRRLLHPTVAPWWMTTEPEAAATAHLLEVGAVHVNEPAPLVADCDAWDAVRDRVRDPGPYDSWCKEARTGSIDGLQVTLDDSSAAALAWTAPMALRYDPKVDPSDLASRLRAARDKEEGPQARAQLAHPAALAMKKAGERRDVLVAATVEESPRNRHGWTDYTALVWHQPGQEAAIRAGRAWNPWAARQWKLGSYEKGTKLEERIMVAIRAARLAPYSVEFASNAALVLLTADRAHDVRHLAQRLQQADPSQTLGTTLLLAMVDAHERRFEAALRTLMAEAMKLDGITSLIDGNFRSLTYIFELANTLGRARTYGDRLAERFVLSDPPRLKRQNRNTLALANQICLMASPATSKRCALRLDALRRSHFFAEPMLASSKLLDGLLRYHEGDHVGMIKAWRGLPEAYGLVPARVALLEEVGRPDLAEIEERRELAGDGPIIQFGGAHSLHASRARRLAKAGDAAAARELAQRVIRAWSPSDAEVPAVADMQALLKELR